MIGRCANCWTLETRYGLPEVMNAACRVCGGFLFWCLHFGFERGQAAPWNNHWVLLHLGTKTLLSEDLCQKKKADG